jgi:hypothetical protein
MLERNTKIMSILMVFSSILEKKKEKKGEEEQNILV